MTHKNVQLYFFIVLLSTIFIFNVAIFLPFIKLFTVVGIFAVVFYPIYTKIRKKIIKNKNISALLTILLVAIIVLIPLTFFIIQIFFESKGVYADLGSFDNNLVNISNSINNKLGLILPHAQVDLSAYMGSLFSNLTNSIGGIFSSIFNFSTILLLGFVTLFFFIRDGGDFVNKLIKISPLDDDHDAKILNKLKRTINSIVKGSLVIACLQGILSWFGFLIFGVPNPALWGGLAVFSSLIPGIGTAIVIIPAIIYIFYTGTLFNAIGLLIWGVVIVGLIDNVVRPYLVSQEVNLHPFIILMSIFGGLIMFGAMGFLLGPLLLSFFSVLVELYPTITKGVLDKK